MTNAINARESTGKFVYLHNADFKTATELFQTVDSHPGHSVGRALYHRLYQKMPSSMTERWQGIAANHVELTVSWDGQPERKFKVWMGGTEPESVSPPAPVAQAPQAAVQESGNEGGNMGTLEKILYVGIAIVAFIMLFGESIAAGISAVVLFVGAVFALGGSITMVLWVWQFVGHTAIDLDERKQNMSIQAATVRNQLFLETKRSDLVYAADGFMPVSHTTVISGKYDAPLLELNAHRIDAQRPVANVPHTMTFAPHYSAKGGEIHSAEIPEIAQIAQSAALSLDFRQLFESGQLPRKGFLVGFDTASNEPVIASWKSLYSSLIGGQPGSGKSTLIRSLLAQAAMQKSKFIVLDPHYGAGDESLGESLRPLHSLLLCDIATTSKEMTSALQYVEGIGKRRLLGQDTDKTPVVLVIDETTGLLSRGEIADALIRTLGFISQETRKVGVFAFCIGQNFTGKIMPTEVRNSFVSFISCRARRDVARVQSGSNDFGVAAEGLAIGQAVWMTPSGETHRLAIPNCTMEHLEAIAGEITGVNAENQDLRVNTRFQAASKPLPTHFQPTSKQLPACIVEAAGSDSGSGLEAGAEAGAEAAQKTEVMSAEERNIVQLFKGGSSRRDICKQVFGVTGGRKYDEAASKVEVAIRKAMQ